MTTYEKISCEQKYNEDKNEDRLILANAMESKKFFTILHPFYETARRAIQEEREEARSDTE